MSELNFLCVLGDSQEEWKKALHWVEENDKRRLIVVQSFDAQDPKVTSYCLETPFQIPFLAEKIASDTVLLPMEILGGEEGIFSVFRKELEKARIRTNLLLSDGADFGCSLVKECIAKKGKKTRQGLKLKNAFENVPAIVVGAGPSLKKIQELLPKFQEKALVLTGGSAMNLLDIAPHFASSIDKIAPYQKFKEFAFAETPFFIQNRMNAKNFSLIHGEAILFPDSHFSFLSDEEAFDGGWTVGTFLIAIATWIGCNPIFLAGMDFCYDAEGRKYGKKTGALEGSEELFKVKIRNGKEALTQQDWLMAHDWIEGFAKEHPETKFIDVTGEGIGFSHPVRTQGLDAIFLAEQKDLKKRVHDAVQHLPFSSQIPWEDWKMNLERCLGIFSEAELQKEIVYEKLLFPLWNLWAPVFQRTFASSELDMHRLVFFQTVIEEHLHVFD